MVLGGFAQALERSGHPRSIPQLPLDRQNFLEGGPRCTLEIWKEAKSKGLAKRTLQKLTEELEITSKTVWENNRALTYWLLQDQELPAELDKAKADLEHCTITSPVDGVVISRSVDVGQTVAASLQAPVIFQIANDLTKMQIDSNVAEADVGAVEVGQDVDFTVDAFPTRTFHGKVVQVRNAPITVQNVVTYDTSMVYLTTLPGGWVADRLIGAQRAVLYGGGLIAAGHFSMAVPSLAMFYLGLLLIVIGTGLLKGNVGILVPVQQQCRRIVARDVSNWAIRIEPVALSDGIVTEVTEGLKEGDKIITAELSSATPAASPGTNPFSGGGRRFP